MFTCCGCWFYIAEFALNNSVVAFYSHFVVRCCLFSGCVFVCVLWLLWCLLAVFVIGSTFLWFVFILFVVAVCVLRVCLMDMMFCLDSSWVVGCLIGLYTCSFVFCIVVCLLFYLVWGYLLLLCSFEVLFVFVFRLLAAWCCWFWLLLRCAVTIFGVFSLLFWVLLDLLMLVGLRFIVIVYLWV